MRFPKICSTKGYKHIQPLCSFLVLVEEKEYFPKHKGCSSSSVSCYNSIRLPELSDLILLILKPPFLFLCISRDVTLVSSKAKVYVLYNNGKHQCFFSNICFLLLLNYKHLPVFHCVLNTTNHSPQLLTYKKPVLRVRGEIIIIEDAR